MLTPQHCLAHFRDSAQLTALKDPTWPRHTTPAHAPYVSLIGLRLLHEEGVISQNLCLYYSYVTLQ